MTIELTKEQFANIIRSVCIANDILGVLSDMVSEKYNKRADEIEELKKYLLHCAEENNYSEVFDYYYGDIIVNDYISDEADEIREEYEEFIFWDELEYRLANRDLEKTLSEEEKKSVFEDYLLYFKKLKEFSQKYSQEFMTRGIERLYIKNKA